MRRHCLKVRFLVFHLVGKSSFSFIASVFIVFVFVTDFISSYGGIIFAVVSPSLIILPSMSVWLGWLVSLCETAVNGRLS